MLSLSAYHDKVNLITAFKNKWLLGAAIFWTFIDFYILKVWNAAAASHYLDVSLQLPALLIKIAVIIGTNVILGVMLFHVIPMVPIKANLIINRVIKIMVAVIGIVSSVIIVFYTSRSFDFRTHYINRHYISDSFWMLDAAFIKFLAVIFLLVTYRYGQKFTSGFFWGIITGRYSIPRNEDRIILFIDLKNSTPVSEKLDPAKYFRFIREFINNISSAAAQNDGDIYQYVGDEVIVTWPSNKKNSEKCIKTLIMSKKKLNAGLNYFRKEFGEIPEFRAGIHSGQISVGEIGVLKREIAMSGETMNTAARIRSACSELNQKIIISNDFLNLSSLKPSQFTDLGLITLKGLEKKPIQLFSLNI